MKAIDKEFVERARSMAREASIMEDVIADRIDYIIREMCKTFNTKLLYWYFPDAAEGEVGNLWEHFSNEQISVITQFLGDKSKNGSSRTMSIIDKFDNELFFDFDSFIPTRWLFEEFENELIEGKKKFEEKEALCKLEQNKKKSLKKIEEEKLIESVKRKLSKEELKVIKKIYNKNL